MIYTPMTKKALSIAYAAHHGQVDHSGLPYIHHPLHLAETMTNELACTVALLHDVVEDTAVTLEDLAKEFPPEVVEAVGLLTHEETSGIQGRPWIRPEDILGIADRKLDPAPPATTTKSDNFITLSK